MKRIFAFTGKMGSGKSTAIELLRKNTNREVVLVKFAQPLYDIQNYVYKRTGLTLEGPKDRPLLQWLGTEWGRSKDVNLLVNIWKDTVRLELEQNPTSIIVCDDCRFDNEAEAIKDMRGTIVRVVAPHDARRARIPLVNVGHASEAGVNPRYINFTIANAGSMQDLEDHVIEMLEEYNL